MDLSKIAIGEDVPHEVNVIIENPMGGDPVKYEVDKASGAVYVDRFLHTAMRYPGNYGFVPHTLSDDGDPLDCMVVSTTSVAPGAVMAVRPIGVMMMEDESGMDEKVLAVPADRLHPYHDNVKEAGDLRPILVEQIEHFFSHYKDLEPNKWVRTGKWGDAAAAKRIIEESIARLERKAG